MARTPKKKVHDEECGFRKHCCWFYSTQHKGTNKKGKTTSCITHRRHTKTRAWIKANCLLQKTFAPQRVSLEEWGTNRFFFFLSVSFVLELFKSTDNWDAQRMKTILFLLSSGFQTGVSAWVQNPLGLSFSSDEGWMKISELDKVLHYIPKSFCVHSSWAQMSHTFFGFLVRCLRLSFSR